MTLGFILFLLALGVAGVVVWDFDQKWDEQFNSKNWGWNEEEL